MNQRDTSPPDLHGLVEFLARRFHQAGGRPAVSWAELSEPEKRVLLSRARQTLVAIHEGGYTISRTDSGDGAVGDPQPAIDSDALRLRIAEAEHFLHSGEPLLAYNEIQQGLETWPESVRLRQLQGLALARSGAMRRANMVLQTLREEGLSDGETLGLLARTHKDLGLSARDGDERAEHLSAALSIYNEAYLGSLEKNRVEDAYYTGINAATLALWLGEDAKARAIAANVRDLCLRELEGDISADAEYWIRATLGEAALVLGNLDVASAAYAGAARIAKGRFGDIASTRRQARLLLNHLGLEAGWLEKILAAPPVLVYSGHMIDAPGRSAPRFPSGLESQVRAAIRNRIESIDPIAAYGSAACGTDILCLEAMLEMDREIHVILPFPPEEFRRASVDFAQEGNWGERFERVLGSAKSLTVTSEHRATGSVSSYEYANLVLTGMGCLRADVLGTHVVGLAVWDGRPGDGAGGTASALELWRERELRVEAVELPQPMEQPVPGGGEDARRHREEERLVSGFRHEIKAMLFADAVGYSRLTEDQIPIFVSRFLGSVATLNEQVRHPPIHCETAGDGLYMVFANVADAAIYGLCLSEMVHETDWEQEGMPGDMDIRVALHCGPVFCGTDPITHLPLFTGPHTSRTARIEPITPPGHVYASSAFAAVAAAAGVADVDFRYVGRTQLAKKYGSLPLFHVRRAASAGSF